jgi:hypothetical protein
MPLKAILFILGFTVCAGGALFHPVLGVIGYVLHYDIGPERLWWNAYLHFVDVRYSFTLAVMTAIGIALNYSKLRWGKAFFVGQEKLMLIFLVVVWGATLINEMLPYTQVDPPYVKMTKMMIFVLMMTHVVTTVRSLDLFYWALVAGSLILGLEAYYAGGGAFASGRLEDVGGPDFTDSNTLAAYLAAMVPFIGVQFLRSRWIGKLVCMAAGAFTVDAIILTRSRGAVIGLAAGALMAAILAPRQHRGKVILGLVVATIGGASIADTGFWERAGTIGSSSDQMDASAMSRWELAVGGVAMSMDHPLGVGPDNFKRLIGRYVPKHAERDAHNTYVRCACELGWAGFLLFAAMLVNGFLSTWRVGRRARDLPAEESGQIIYLSYGLLVSLVTLAACGLWGSLVYTESLWWLLALPVCMGRAMANAEEDVAAKAPAALKKTDGRFKPRRGKTSKNAKEEAWTPAQ